MFQTNATVSPISRWKGLPCEGAGCDHAKTIYLKPTRLKLRIYQEKSGYSVGARATLASLLVMMPKPSNFLGMKQETFQFSSMLTWVGIKIFTCAALLHLSGQIAWILIVKLVISFHCAVFYSCITRSWNNTVWPLCGTGFKTQTSSCSIL